MGMLLRRHYKQSVETNSPQKESIDNKEKSKKEKPAKKQVKKND